MTTQEVDLTELWRPKRLTEFIGQPSLINLLVDEIDAAIAMDSPLPNMIFTGPPGLGKSSLPPILAAERGSDPAISIMGGSATHELLSGVFGGGDHMPKDSVVRATGYTRNASNGLILRNDQPRKPSIVVIDEAEKIPRALYETVLYNVMEPGPNGRVFMAKRPGRGTPVPCWCPPCTVILLTNFLGDITKVAPGAISRCQIKHQFVPYTPPELFKIVSQYAQHANIAIDTEAVQVIADRSAGTPRTAIHYLERIYRRLIARQKRNETTEKTITVPLVLDMFENRMNVDGAGMDAEKRRCLQALIDSGGVASTKTICGFIGTDEKTYLVNHEPFLLTNGLIRISGRGREITEKGINHLKPNGSGEEFSRLL